MENNPFNRERFQSIWLKYFNNSDLPIEFKSIKHAKFYKSKKSPFHVNVGRNITNGMSYEIDSNEIDYKGKSFLVYDVPTFYNIETNLNTNLKVRKVKQYAGLTTNLSDFKNFDDYYNFKFKSKKRYRLNTSIKRLDACFNINHKIFYGSISKTEYDHIYKYLIINIKKRFDTLNIDNDIVVKKDYYYELCYELICNKEAVLNVIYDNDIPISISINFVSDQIMHFAITSFNIDYQRYELGHINIMKLLQWCFDNGLKVLDFSKGYAEYKTRWSNDEYQFEHHVLYDSKSIKSKVSSSLFCNYFIFKQYLRNKKINLIFNKIKFIYKGNNAYTSEKNIQIDDISNSKLDYSKLKEIDFQSKECEKILNSLYTYLYNNPEKTNQLKVYKNVIDDDSYFVIGEINKLKIHTL